MKLNKLRDRLGEVEQKVAALESEIGQHEAALADFKSVEETMRLTEIAAARRKELEACVAEWEELSAALEASA
jgi:predicted  nucleic acid-binding Zn-ribbon protein